MKKFATPIFLTSVIIILIAIPIALYYLTIGSGGGMGLAGMKALIIGIGSLVIIYIERQILKEFNPKNIVIWLIEIPLIVGAIFLYLYSERKVIYTVDDSSDWFAEVFVNEKYEIPEHTFPFNINYIIGKRQVIFINPALQTNYHRDICSWGGYLTDGVEVVVDSKIYRVCIFYNPRIDVKNKKTELIRSIVLNEIQKKL